MNKYYRLLDRILIDGKTQTGRKGTSRYLLNESLSLTPSDLLDIFEGHNIALLIYGNKKNNGIIISCLPRWQIL